MIRQLLAILPFALIFTSIAWGLAWLIVTYPIPALWGIGIVLFVLWIVWALDYEGGQR